MLKKMGNNVIMVTKKAAETASCKLDMTVVLVNVSNFQLVEMESDKPNMKNVIMENK